MSSTSERWFGAGHSTAADSAKAGGEAAAAAIAGRRAAAVFAFTSGGHDPAAVLAAVRAEAGDAVVVGGTGFGELSPAGATRHGVAVAALGGDGFTARVRTADIGELGAREAGAEAARAVAEIDAPYTALLLICDGTALGPHEIVRGAYSVVGAAVPMVGGLTADPVQLCGDRVLANSVIGVALGSPRPVGIGMAHGWRRIEPPMIVTRSEGERLCELDGEPAFDALVRRRGTDGTAERLFTDSGFLQPIGLARRSGLDIRSLKVGPDGDTAVYGTSEIPQGSLVWAMDAKQADIVAGAGAAIDEAVAALGGHEPLGVLAFDCGGRKIALGADGIGDEVAAMRAALGDVPFAGFYTLGEIARVRGAAGMHQLTLVALALA
ncbi:FIST signal transduction protein [Dactylosporangium sp. CS-033363]|uniref:FIST signal transduction protein n=1 Tax=Dactylosporangium sp. CS-033363 TaxID=3239935 RepID=UPI003D8E503D